MKELLCAAALVAALASPALVYAKDYGQLGSTFAIAEVDMMKAISAKLHAMQASGELAQAQNHLKGRTIQGVIHPPAVEGLSPATSARSFTYDPTIEFDADVRDSKGNLIVARGARFNPLKTLPFNEVFVFFDGERKAEMAYVLDHYKAQANAKLIMVRGSPFEAMKTYQHRFYFDQGGLLTTKLGVRHTPTIVQRDGDVLRLNEIVL